MTDDTCGLNNNNNNNRQRKKKQKQKYMRRIKMRKYVQMRNM